MLLGSVYIRFFQDVGAGNTWLEAIFPYYRVKNSSLQIEQLAQWVLCQERPMTEMATYASNRWSKERNSVCGLFLFPQGFGGADKFETRLLIPSKMGGAVIGKKGCNIQQLRSDYNATIRFSQLREWSKANFSKSFPRVPDAPGPERIMSVTCEDLEVTNGSAGFS